jgi:hypothetical protein
MITNNEIYDFYIAEIKNIKAFSIIEKQIAVDILTFIFQKSANSKCRDRLEKAYYYLTLLNRHPLHKGKLITYFAVIVERFAKYTKQDIAKIFYQLKKIITKC